MKTYWIKPEDGLPPNNNPILIYAEYNVTKSRCISFGWYDESSKSWFDYLGYKKNHRLDAPSRSAEDVKNMLRDYHNTHA